MMRDVQMVVARGKTFTALTVMNDCCAGCDARGDELLCQELPACRAESRADGTGGGMEAGRAAVP